VHSFSRLAYLALLLPSKIAKVMSYQREPTIGQITKATFLAKRKTLTFTGCSNYIANQIIPYAPACTVYNGVPIDLYTPQLEYNNEAPLCFLGRIEAIKGTHTAIEVALRCGKKLIIAGNIPRGSEQYFKTQVEPFLSERIQYIGPVDDEQKNNLLRDASALLMPIQWNEPFGIVMIEAMACGTPVIGLERGAVPEIVKHGVSGFICTEIDDMCEGVRNLHHIDRKKVYSHLKKHFSATLIANGYLSLYQRIRVWHQSDR
jgi:glycosyltransferase involved in cell wall biosynthesis